MCDKEQMTKVQVMMSRFYNRLQTKSTVWAKNANYAESANRQSHRLNTKGLLAIL